MGWQDRDYAADAGGRTHHPGGGGRGIGGGRMPSITGRFASIVNVLLAINIGVFVLGAMFPDLHRLFFGFGALRANDVLHGQVWQLITAQYLHAGMGHLFFNMLVLHFLGRPLEQMWSRERFFAIYTISGLAGNIFFTLLALQIPALMHTSAVGASGCIFGLLGVVAVLFPTATVYVYFLFPMKIRTAAYIFAAIALFSIINRGKNYGGEACHLAGLGFGVWWAMKGDAWWSRTQWRLPRRRRAARGPSGFAAKIAERQTDEETIDRILKKVYEGGIHSLNASEKRSLQAATDRQREREQRAGRVDRL